MDGQIDQAISQFQKAIHLKPDFAEAHYNLGVAQGIKGQVLRPSANFGKPFGSNLITPRPTMSLALS